jgi:lipid A 3-O-deacylase
VQGGAGGKGTTMAGVGIVWEWDFQRMRRKAELTAHTELMLNHWNYHALGGGGEGLTQVALLPSLRMRLDRGQSRWFIELGIGVSWMDQTFMSERKTFGTRWNFYDMMGIGHSFGAEHEHEVALRWVHVSNGGLKEAQSGPGLPAAALRLALLTALSYGRATADPQRPTEGGARVRYGRDTRRSKLVLTGPAQTPGIQKHRPVRS